MKPKTPAPKTEKKLFILLDYIRAHDMPTLEEMAKHMQTPRSNITTLLDWLIERGEVTKDRRGIIRANNHGIIASVLTRKE